MKSGGGRVQIRASAFIFLSGNNSQEQGGRRERRVGGHPITVVPRVSFWHHVWVFFKYTTRVKRLHGGNDSKTGGFFYFYCRHFQRESVMRIHMNDSIRCPDVYCDNLCQHAFNPRLHRVWKRRRVIPPLHLNSISDVSKCHLIRCIVKKNERGGGGWDGDGGLLCKLRAKHICLYLIKIIRTILL